MTKTSLRHLPLGEFGTENETDADLITYIVVGRAVIVWGSLEQNFSNMVLRLHRQYGEAEPPFQLKRKIEFWNACFKKQSALAGMKELALAFSRDLLEAKKQRDTLLHFAWDVSDVSKPLKGRSLRSTAKGHIREALDLPLKSINGFVNRTSELNLRVFPLIFELLRPPTK